MQFIPIVEYDNKGEIADFSVSPSAYGDFLCRLFNLWYNNGHPNTSVRDFDSLLHKEVRGRCTICIYDNRCGQHVVVEHNGDVYACDFFVGPAWKLGNVMEKRIIDMVNSAKQNTFGRVKTELPNECKNCKWLPNCRGGCPKDRLNNPFDRELNYFCEAYKMFFDHADQFFKKLADDWKQEQAIFNTELLMFGLCDKMSLCEI